MTKTVVIVEDEPDLRTIYQKVLESAGYRVIVGGHGAEGVTVVRRNHADLVIMDLRMPIMDGWRALEYLKADARTSKVPVWAMSAHLQAEVAAHRSASGFVFDRFLPKPIEPLELAQAVVGFLGRQGSTPPACRAEWSE